MTNKTRPQTTPTLGRVLCDIDHTQRAHKLDISKDSKNNNYDNNNNNKNQIYLLRLNHICCMYSHWMAREFAYIDTLDTYRDWSHVMNM